MLWGEKSRGLKKKKRKNERIKGGKKKSRPTSLVAQKRNSLTEINTSVKGDSKPIFNKSGNTKCKFPFIQNAHDTTKNYFDIQLFFAMNKIPASHDFRFLQSRHIDTL